MIIIAQNPCETVQKKSGQNMAQIRRFIAQGSSGSSVSYKLYQQQLNLLNFHYDSIGITPPGIQ